MKLAFRIFSVFGLLLVIAPPVLCYGIVKGEEVMKFWMLVGTVLWFVFSYLGFRQNPEQRELEDEHTPVA